MKLKPNKEQIDRIKAMKLRTHDVLNLSQEDFDTWAYLKSLTHGHSDIVVSMALQRLLKIV